MAIFVLVAGAWHGGWCWERIVPLLEAGGHRVIAPDLLGMGADRTPLGEVSLARWADQVAALIRAQDEPVILVGHSRGGIVISEVAERVPDQIASLVYLAAYLLPDCETIMSMSAKSERTSPAGLLIMAPDGTATLNPALVGQHFYNTTEPDWVDRALSLVGAEPMVTMTTQVSLTVERFGSVRRAYIACERDQAVPLSLQRLMQQALPCDPVFTLPGDHSPFYSDPGRLADCLKQLAVSITQ